MIDYSTDEDFEFTLDELGTPLQHQPMPKSELDYCRDRIPSRLLQFMEENGQATYLDGAVTICAPSQFEDVLRYVFKDDPDLSADDCTLISYGAFGRLSVWSQRYNFVKIGLAEGIVSAALLVPSEFPASMMPPPPKKGRAPGFRSVHAIINDIESVDFRDFKADYMLEACAAQHGPPALGECYGFFPALAMVGLESPMRSVANIRRVKALEHFAMLAQMQDFHIERFGPQGIEIVRRVGGD